MVAVPGMRPALQRGACHMTVTASLVPPGPWAVVGRVNTDETRITRNLVLAAEIHCHSDHEGEFLRCWRTPCADARAEDTL